MLLAIVWGSSIVFAILRKTTSPSAGDSDLAALALAGWPGPLLVMAGAYFLLTRVVPIDAAGIILLAAAALTALLCLRGLRISIEIALPVLIFLGLAFLRIGYAAEVVLPQYFDSAWHYGLIKSIVEMEHGAPLAWPVEGWYHPGYHLILAGLASFSGGGLARLMLIFGQLTLAALPLPLYPLVRASGGSRSAGLLAVTLAASAWSMPSHAVDWGKYPAMLSLLTIEFALGAFLIGRTRAGLGAALVAQILHTRAVILLALAAGARWVARKRGRWLMVAGCIILAVEVFWILRDPASAEVFQPYMVLSSVPVLILAILAFWQSEGAALVTLLVVDGMLAAMLLPVTRDLTLLDRPLVEMALSLPLAFLGGVGAARLPRAATAVIIVLVLLLSFNTRNFVPSECCRLVRHDDLAALDWLDANLPPHAVVGIAGTDLRVSSEEQLLQRAGTDAGVWVGPLTGRRVETLPYSIDTAQTSTRDSLCRDGITHLYVGEQQRSFKFQPGDWLREVYSQPGVRIVEVVCLGW